MVLTKPSPKRNNTLCFVFISLLLAVIKPVYAQNFTIPKGEYSLNLASAVHIYYDTHSNKNLNDIRSLASKNQFHPNSYYVPFWGKYDGSMWVMLVVKNLSAKSRDLNLLIKNRALFSYHIRPNGILQDTSGKILAIHKSSGKYFRGFTLKIEPNANDTIFIKSIGSYHLRYKFGNTEVKIQSADTLTLVESFKNNTLFYGFYFGFIFIVVLYTLVVFLTFKEISFFWFIAYLLGMAMVITANYDVGMLYFWPNSPDFEISFYINVFSNILASVSIVMFIHTFFKPHRSLPVFHNYLSILPISITALQLANIALKDYMSLSMLSNYCTLALVVFYYIEAIVLAFKKVKYALTMVMAFSCLVLGVLITNLIFIEVINYSIHKAKFIHISGILLSCIGMVFIIFSYLVHQRKEKERAQLEAITALEENERLVLDENALLEEKVKIRTIQLEEEKKKSDDLLLNILPEEIAHELKNMGKSKARLYQDVTVFFSDFVNFTGISTQLSPEDLVDEIDYCFQKFDQIIDQFNLEKIKTIGDAYMAAGGVPVADADAAVNTVKAAIEMQKFMLARKSEMESKGKSGFEMRVGIHTGPLVAGIVGIKKFQYDLWGDTVNTAARIESTGEPGKINISEHTYNLIKDNPQFKFENRGKIEAKGKGKINMYFVS